jgi:hypothetical protein
MLRGLLRGGREGFRPREWESHCWRALARASRALGFPPPNTARPGRPQRHTPRSDPLTPLFPPNPPPSEFPGQLQKILEWFRDYKIPDGKPANAFGYDNKCMDKDFALKVVDETHGFYNALKSGRRPNDEELSLI